MTVDNGWQASAGAWVQAMEGGGDFSRQAVLDRPMLAAVQGLAAGARALDVGCGEGRFCRMLREAGLRPTGLEPTPALFAVARERDPAGDYVAGRAEALPFERESFDLVVSYLTLLDIDDHEAALAEMVRVLRPGGRLLIANLQPHVTAGRWVAAEEGGEVFAVERYLETRADWAAWSGIRIRNWHRPLGAYLRPLLAAGLRLCRFEEPLPQEGPPERLERYRQNPFLMLMEWEKPGRD